MASLSDVETYILDHQPGTIVGVDEAGRGPCAGVLVAAAAAVPTQGWEPHKLVRDSKKLKPHQMKVVHDHYAGDDRIVIGVGIATSSVIDKVGIDKAQAWAQGEAIRRTFDRLAYKPFVVVDGITPPDIDSTATEFIMLVPKADLLIPAVSLASIFAKYIQLQRMDELHERFPVYGFNEHHGYPTKQHKQALATHGPCIAHRRSYRPVREVLSREQRLPTLADLGLEDAD